MWPINLLTQEPNYTLWDSLSVEIGGGTMTSRVEVEFQGRVYSARYGVGRGGVTVVSPMGLSKFLNIEGMTEEGAAKQGLRELLTEAERSGALDGWPARSIE